MAEKDHMAIFPSRANFVLMKQKMAAAQRGVTLLRRKRDAMELQLRLLRKELEENEKRTENLMRIAYFSIAKASFYNTDLKQAIAANPPRSNAYLRMQQNKILGFTIQKFQLIIEPSTALPYTGLSTGGRQIADVRKCFQDALENLVTNASLHYSEQLLNEAVRQNNMRVNGLEFVLLPRFNKTINYIANELDELEREDFYRIKCFKAHQEKEQTLNNNHVEEYSNDAIITDGVKQTRHLAGLKSSTSHTFVLNQVQSYPTLPLPLIFDSEQSTPSLDVVIDENLIKPKKVVESSDGSYTSLYENLDE